MNFHLHTIPWYEFPVWNSSKFSMKIHQELRGRGAGGRLLPDPALPSPGEGLLPRPTPQRGAAPGPRGGAGGGRLCGGPGAPRWERQWLGFWGWKWGTWGETWKKSSGVILSVYFTSCWVGFEDTFEIFWEWVRSKLPEQHSFFGYWGIIFTKFWSILLSWRRSKCFFHRFKTRRVSFLGVSCPNSAPHFEPWSTAFVL